MKNLLIFLLALLILNGCSSSGDDSCAGEIIDLAPLPDIELVFEESIDINFSEYFSQSEDKILSFRASESSGFVALEIIEISANIIRFKAIRDLNTSANVIISDGCNQKTDSFLIEISSE